MDIYRFLDENGIIYERYDHPPVYTCEEAERLVPPLAAASTKNIFLRDKAGKRHFLVVIGYEKRVELKSLSTLLGVRNLSLASSERLERHLGVDPGSVSLLGIVNNPDHSVEIVIDEDLWRAEALACHPLVNTSTLVISRDDIERMIGVTGHEFRVMKIPCKNQPA